MTILQFFSGVLLLNSVLTNHQKKPEFPEIFHSCKRWEMFTNSVVTWLSDNLNGVVFLLWGEMAREKIPYIDLVRLW